MSLIEQALRKTRIAGAKAVTSPLAPASAATTGSYPTGALRGSPSKRLTLDMDWLRVRGIIPPEEAQRRHIAQIRSIKNKLLRYAQASGSARDRVIMITSALSGDGKTFSSINLALSLATERDFHVLLVDGDAPKPNVGQMFGIENSPGLLEAARDPNVDVEKLIIGTDMPGLDFLSAGRGGVDAAEVLSSTRMRATIGRLAAVPDRIVLLDSPPLLQTSESAVLSQHAGQVLLVVRESVTPQRAVQDSLALLGERTGLNLMLNGVTDSKLEEYYLGYGQNYGYGDREEAGA
jgi:protein-tyrosine kinase